MTDLALVPQNHEVIHAEHAMRDLTQVRPMLLLPTYNGWSRNRQAVVNFVKCFPSTGAIVEVASSALGHCFNMCYQIARYEHEKNQTCTHAIMLHADVVPVGGDWAVTLLEESLRVQADILSVVLPIKTPEGVTSTAVERKDSRTADRWHPIRFTMREIMQLPETFTHPYLMLNTGLMVVNLTKAWTRELVFDLESKVDLARYKPYFLPEDWKMSRFAQINHGSLWATRKVRAVHVGEVPFGNDAAWGTKATEGAMEVYLQEGGHGHEEHDNSADSPDAAR